MNGYTSRIHARVLNLSDFDIILGFDWLRKINPIIDWRALKVQVPGEEGGFHQLLPAATNHYVDSRPAAFTVNLEELIEFLSASQTAKILRDPTTEAYIYIVKSTLSEFNITTLINFASNNTLIYGSPSSIFLIKAV